MEKTSSNGMQIVTSAVASTLDSNAENLPLTISPAATKILPNIQPKTHGVPVTIQPQRNIVPKNGAGPQTVTATPAVPNQSGNIIIPQGVQHVLINGQVFPIIQTAQGTHLLIHQPIAQLQQTSTTTPATNTTTTTSPSKTSPIKNPLSTASPIVPVQIRPPPGRASKIPPVTVRPTIRAPGSHMPGPRPEIPPHFQVNPTTHELLTKIKSQIDELKSRTDLNTESKTTLLQLEQTREKILKDIRKQLQHAQAQSRTKLNPAANNIRQPLVTDNNNKTDNKTIMTLINNTFCNVKHGDQFYNIQLTDQQKQSMAQDMIPLTGPQRHNYLINHQQTILKTFLTNQAQGGRPNQTAGTVRPPSRTYQRTRGARNSPLPPTSKTQTPSPINTSIPTTVDLITKPNTPRLPTPPPTNNTTPPARKPGRQPRRNKPNRPRYEKLQIQYERDKETLVKSLHKKPFLSKLDACQRLMRYHIYFASDTSVLKQEHDNHLFTCTAEQTIDKKDKLESRLRKLLWSEARSTDSLADRLVTSQLALQAEQEQLHLDMKMAEESLPEFKGVYSVSPDEKTSKHGPSKSPQKSKNSKSNKQSVKPANTKPSVVKTSPTKQQTSPASSTKQQTSPASATKQSTKQRTKASVPISFSFNKPVMNKPTRTRFRDRKGPYVPPPPPVIESTPVPPQPITNEESETSDSSSEMSDELSPVKSLVSEEWDFTSELKNALRRRSSDEIVSRHSSSRSPAPDSTTQSDVDSNISVGEEDDVIVDIGGSPERVDDESMDTRGEVTPERVSHTPEYLDMSTENENRPSVERSMGEAEESTSSELDLDLDQSLNVEETSFNHPEQSAADRLQYEQESVTPYHIPQTASISSLSQNPSLNDSMESDTCSSSPDEIDVPLTIKMKNDRNPGSPYVQLKPSDLIPAQVSDDSNQYSNHDRTEQYNEQPQHYRTEHYNRPGDVTQHDNEPYQQQESFKRYQLPSNFACGHERMQSMGFSVDTPQINQSNFATEPSTEYGYPELHSGDPSMEISSQQFQPENHYTAAAQIDQNVFEPEQGDSAAIADEHLQSTDVELSEEDEDVTIDDPVGSLPAQTYEYHKAEPVYQEPEPVYREPNPVHQEPGSVYQEPGSVYQEPDYEEPEHGMYQESQTAYQEQEHEPIPQELETVYQQPVYEQSSDEPEISEYQQISPEPMEEEIEQPARIAPLRINKRKLAEYMIEEEGYEYRAAPPIKIRIKKDMFSKWEASSVSGEDSDVEQSDTESVNGVESVENFNRSEAASESEVAESGESYHSEGENVQDEYEIASNGSGQTDTDYEEEPIDNYNPQKITIRFGESETVNHHEIPFTQYESESEYEIVSPGSDD